MRPRVCALAAPLSAAVLALCAAGAAAAAPPPPGANLACTPSAAHPYPAVLVRGTAENRFDNWQATSPALKAAGYCVYVLDYGSHNGSGALGVYGLDFVERSAQQPGHFVDAVLAQTGAAKVDLVGRSQGGMMPRYYVKFLGGDAKVDDLVGLSPSNHGTTQPLASSLGRLPGLRAAGGRLTVPGAPQQRDESPGPVGYTNIVTRYDEVVTP